MSKWRKAFYLLRNLVVVDLHRQGYFGTEIAKMLGRQFGHVLSRERVRQILNESNLKLDDETFDAIRVRRRYPQEYIKCACGCGGWLLKYRYYGTRIQTRRYFCGHAPIGNPEEHHRKIAEAKKRQWAEGVYENRRPGARELANRSKFIAFVAEHPGCTPYRVAKETGITHPTAIFHAKKLCNINKGKLPAKYILMLKGDIANEDQNLAPND